MELNRQNLVGEKSDYRKLLLFQRIAPEEYCSDKKTIEKRIKQESFQGEWQKSLISLEN